MKPTSILLLPILLAFLSCSKPAGKSNDQQTASATNAPSVEAAAQACPDFFYYYNQEKVALQVNPEVLLVGFEQGQTPVSQSKLLRSFAEFAELGPEQRSAAGTFSVVKLKAGTSCAQVLALTKKLQQLPEVTFANPTFKPPHTLGTTYAWIGVTSEFMVTLKSAAELEVFKKALSQTKTTILDPLGETTFLVQATKNSQGNALEMANYFHEQPYVQTSEPDFFMAAPGN